MSTGQPFTALVGGDPVGMDWKKPVSHRTCRFRLQTLQFRNPNNYIKTQCLAYPVPGIRREIWDATRWLGQGCRN
jgi:hypothetical protein